MRKSITAIVISLLGISANATEVIELNSQQTGQNLKTIKSALIILLKNGLIARDSENGKLIIKSTEANSANSQSENTEVIDLDQLESEMRTSHVTDI